LQYSAVKGFKDILPDQVGVWNRIESEAKRVFEYLASGRLEYLYWKRLIFY